MPDEPPKFLSLNEVCAMTTLSRTAINKWRVKGKFPERVDLGGRRAAFLYDEVVAWMNARIAARDAKCGAGHAG